MGYGVMSRSHDRMVFWFRMNNCRATLKQILERGEPWSYEFRARMAEARRRGIAFVLERGSKPSENVYRMVEQKGQMELAI